MKTRVKILVLFYSLTGKTAELAKFVAEGAVSVADTKVDIKRVPEILADSYFEERPQERQIRDRLASEFPQATREDLLSSDAIAFGTPTHFGSFASQVKHFIDQLAPEWIKGELVGKPVSVFCSSGSTHGGGELTLLSLMIPLFNLGMIPVGIPYPIQGESADFESGSPYGAIFVSGGGRRPSEGDKKTARILGERLGVMAHILSCNCESCTKYKAFIREPGIKKNE
ncbi:MAG: Flavoprotein WrbA [Candidatus Woesebacteria bacterium GW2011_GWA2_44_33]|uniref:Flavoprotein WrbA n=3 Tax=Microgenomates group TaxID=1794810 RepID=A0A0G1QFW8_9BACT|nr:MAG: Flavoprotein WrbA [Candidatus Curtissbacteria bacterium GW2011_GWC1_44_33]KKT65926.1 MAG: Flavoprotein WrbA [Candidatus Woesebacteria bacterium GW2011_GWA2_44_33]KKU16628.1 MAG: Flavoprotein WrbA [Candidatus Woesebacteria bacterium GW2011_GWC2_45_9]